MCMRLDVISVKEGSSELAISSQTPREPSRKHQCSMFINGSKIFWTGFLSMALVLMVCSYSPSYLQKPQDVADIKQGQTLSVTMVNTSEMSVIPGHTKELIDIHAQCQPTIFIQISATVALMFLAGKQSLSCQVWRAKPPNQPGRQACCPVQPHNYARGMHIIHTQLFFSFYIQFFFFSLSRSRHKDFN